MVKAVKMPPAFWNALAVAARARGMTLHAAMRAALVDWLGRDLGMP
jgi:predicted DNA-binding ribbon-helix-helix protein